MIILLMGAPGAGKGTQADLLAERRGYRKLSTGDALRSQIKLRTPIGREAEAIMAAGKLVPDEVLLQILKEELGTNKDEVILLDGYPRNITQAESLERLQGAHKVKGAIHLDVAREDLVSRLSGRRVCSACGATYNVVTMPPRAAGICDKCGGDVLQRPDDLPEKVRVRLNVYDESTRPVLDYYRSRSLYRRVEGAGAQELVYKALEQAIDDL